MRAWPRRMPWKPRLRLRLRLRLKLLRLLRLRLRLGLRPWLRFGLGRTCDNETYWRRQAPNPVQQTNRKPCDKQYCCQYDDDHESNFQIAGLWFVLLDTSRRVGHRGSPPTFIGVPSKHAYFSDCAILITSPSRCLGLCKLSTEAVPSRCWIYKVCTWRKRTNDSLQSHQHLTQTRRDT